MRVDNRKSLLLWLSVAIFMFSFAPARAAVEVDIIALYSPSAEVLFPGTPARIEALFNEANMVHTNSATGITLNPVLIMPYDEPNTSNVNQGALSTMDSDPVLAQLRAAYGADLVVLFTESTGSLCGLGRLGQGNETDGITPFEFNRDATAFSASAIDCDGQTVAHEIGHNFGLDHSLVQGSTGNIVDYGRGHGVNNSFVTIMAYASFFGSADSLNRFSKHTDSNCMGQPCGIAPGAGDEADSFLAMGLVDEDIESYFPGVVVPPNQDTDGDNVPDTWEWENGLNGFIAADGPQDLDGDGWSNVQEFYAGTDPRNSLSFPTPGAGDSDGDGTNDPQDAFPFDPNETLDTDGDAIGNSADLDDDGDGMEDDFEIFHGYNSLNASDANDDSDLDGATNLEEFESGTDPESNSSSPDTQDVFRVSKSSLGSQGNDTSGVPVDDLTGPVAISRDGRLVAFESDAENLVAADYNFAKDVFLHNRVNGVTSLVSISNTGDQGVADSSGPAIAKDEHRIAFVSEASNLVAADTNGASDVFLRDVESSQTEIISIATGGTQGNSVSASPAISADGQVVAFHSFASTLVGSDTNSTRDVFLRDRTGSTTSRVSLSSLGSQGNAPSEAPAISGDGTLVAFHTFATSLLVPDDNGGFPDTLMHDTGSSQTTAVGVDSSENQTNGNSFKPAISDDGRWVAFQSDSFTLAPGITNGNVDIFLRDRTLGNTTRISVSSLGAESNGDSKNASISDDGRYIVFESAATNLVVGDTNGADDVFMHDRITGDTVLVSKNTSGNPGNGHSRNPVISGDGSTVAFASFASDLVYWDQNSQADVFVMGAGVGPVSGNDFNNDGNADILFRKNTGSQLVWTMNGATRTSTAIIGGLSTDWTVVAIDDFDNDGDADILYRDLATGRNQIWTMNGTTRLSANLIGLASTNYTVTGTGDFNNDGNADILFRSSAGSQLVWTMNGSIRTSTVIIGGLSTAWTTVAVDDFDGDGDADILYRDLSTGRNMIWTMNGTTRQSANLIGLASTNYTVSGTGDFNNDGNADILFRSSAGSQLVWTMNGSTRTSTVIIGGLSTAWTTMTVDDYDGDGDADILYRDLSTGRNQIWTMNGTTRQSADLIGLAATSFAVQPE